MATPKQAKPKPQKRQPQARMASALLGKELERYCTFCKKTLPASLHTLDVIRCEKCSEWVCLECRGEDVDGPLCPLCYEPRWKRERLRRVEHLRLIDGLIQCPVDATISIGELIYFSLKNSRRRRPETITRVLFRYLKPGQDHNRLTRSEVSRLLQAAASELPADLRRKRLRGI